jgi:septal ring factor EnvC (AmiA/AmiB activator)
MATNILSVSISKELADFLDENPEISPSKVIQAKLYEIKEQEVRLRDRIKAYEVKMFRQTGRLTKLLEWIQAQGLLEAVPKDVLD